MICASCRDAASAWSAPVQYREEAVRAEHARCPEVARRNRLEAVAVELAGSALCDCQHVLPARPGRNANEALTLDK